MQSGNAKSSSDAMSTMRLNLLTQSAAEAGIQASSQFPRLYGVLLDLPIGDVTATVVSICDGTTSLYTTSSFGVIGAGGHDSVRAASSTFIQATDAYYDDARPTTDFGYPPSNHVRFYLLAYDGVRVLEADLAAVEQGRDRLSSLYAQGQAVLTEVRKIQEGMQGEEGLKPNPQSSTEDAYLQQLLQVMSVGLITTFQIDAAKPLPNLLDLVPAEHPIHGWIAAADLSVESLQSPQAIRRLSELAKCKGLPFFSKRGQLPIAQKDDRGRITPRLFEITISPLQRSALVRLLPEDDPRTVALQRQIERSSGR